MEIIAGIFIVPVILYAALILHYRAGFIQSEKKNEAKIPLHKTKVDVIIAFRNEENNIQNLIKSLKNQDYDPELTKFILVDDHSDDRSMELTIQDIGGDKRFKTLSNNAGEQGKKNALHKAIGLTSGDVVIFTDADCTHHTEWITSMVNMYTSEKPCMILAPVIFTSQNGFISMFAAFEMFALQGVTAGSAFYKNPVMCNGANLLVKREVITGNKELYRSRHASGDDMFLLMRLKKEKKAKILFLNKTNACVNTPSPLNLREFLGQRTRWVSKTGVIKDISVHRDALVTFLTNSLMIVLGTLTIHHRILFWELLFAFLLKNFVDYLLVKPVIKKYGEQRLLKYIIIFELFNLIYIPVLVLFSAFTSFNWKKRTYKR